ncbi:MAG TPA: menaquinone-dependent protoporphyrinogen IX dehydrogenase [Usitatibacter sp.]|nr:menaquinone-dependent protoporphyrinogen IX dehydrogenase [Usitatibacter sp.]
MASILLIFSTHDGQTARIAERIDQVLREAGHVVDIHTDEAAGLGVDILRHDAVVIGGAVHMGRHAHSLEELVRHNHAKLAARPNAFFSVSLSAAGTEAQRGDASRVMAEFFLRTGWQPDDVAIFAGALPYTRYNPFLRFLMKLIVSKAGGDTDTSRDYEYTDWAAVDRFASAIAAKLAVKHFA